MSPLELAATLVGIVGGGGGLIAWARYRSELRQQENADDVARLSAKAELRAAADGMAQKIWEQLGADLNSARKELAECRMTIEGQQKQIQQLLQRISLADRALVEAERQLAVAQAELDRKESVIVKLQEQVATLERLVSELRQQLAECAGGTG